MVRAWAMRPAAAAEGIQQVRFEPTRRDDPQPAEWVSA